MAILVILIVLGLSILTAILLIVASNQRKKDKINKDFEKAQEVRDEIEKIEKEEKPNELQELINKMQEDINLKPEDVVKKFEDEQEKKAIISYKELVDNVKSGKIQAIDDETDKPIDTYQIKDEQSKTIDREESVTPEMLIEAIENITSNSKEEVIEKIKEFRSSDYISPIYGIMKDNMSYPTIKKKEVTLDAISNTRDYTELTEEIKRQEEFLRELKEFRDSYNKM